MMIRAGCLAAAAVCILGIGAAGWWRPDLDWDTLAYVGIVQGWKGDSPAQAMTAAYADVDALAAARGLEARAVALREGAYRAAVAADPVVFAEQLPFYRIRPLYLAAVAGMSALTGSVAAATVLVSVLSITLCGFGLLWWGVRVLGPVPGSVIAALFMLTLPIGDVARFSTPDAMMTALAALGVALMLAERPMAGTCVLLLGVLVRTDMQVFNLCLAVADGVLRRRWKPGLVLAASVPLGAAVNAWAGNYGYAALYHFTFITPFIPHPAVLQGRPIPPSAFLKNTVFGLWYSLGNGGLWPVLALMAACALLLRRWGTAAAVLLAVIGATVARYILFPAPDSRMSAPAIAMLAVLLVHLLAGVRDWTREGAWARVLPA